MNVHCDKFNCRQTPTHITRMILSLDDNGKIDGGWRGAMRRYIHWCWYEYQNNFSALVDYEVKQAGLSQEDALLEVRERHLEEMQTLENLLATSKRMRWYEL